MRAGGVPSGALSTVRVPSSRRSFSPRWSIFTTASIFSLSRVGRSWKYFVRGIVMTGIKG